jgi:recombination protein RecR
MMQKYPSQLLENAVNAFASLPGIGRKSALRMALHILRQGPANANKFISAISEMSQNIQYCEECHNISDKPKCEICSDPRRDQTTICVVESIKEVMLIENTAQYHGVYHVLGGVISPMNGISPSDLEISSLVERVEQGNIKEVILALSPNMEGDTTCFYIYRKLAHLPVAVTTIARGVAIGDDLEYADEITLGRSILNRITYNKS